MESTADFILGFLVFFGIWNGTIVDCLGTIWCVGLVVFIAD